MEQIFDFDRIRALLTSDRFRLWFDAMDVVTGPHAREILERRLGAPEGAVLHGEQLPDFGGALHDPDSNSMTAPEWCCVYRGRVPPERPRACTSNATIATR